ncbi:MAG: family 43 glycosylhydrolase [Verrucomicrobia bacterium]|nr:family 43 glycosylhydrolase [Verrucomicrobiota bacterium]
MRSLLLCGFAFGLVAGIGSEAFPIPIADLRIRDPFVYADPATKSYYLYAQTGNRRVEAQPGLGVEVYRSRDLTNWSEPTLVFRRPADFWGGTEIWAPEMHALGGRYFLFVSFNGRDGGRGTQILRADAPTGPFEVFSPDANTPPEQRCLDGTPWVDPGGNCWLIYCHEWVQLGDGAMRAVRMRPDWSARLGEPIELFRASQAPWVNHLANPNPAVTTNFVTDGPWLHRTARGRLLMLWSSFGPNGYTLGLASSDDGFVDGHWTHDPEPLFAGDGGHGMLFRTFEGQLKLVLHQPNHGGLERARFFDLAEEGERVALRARPPIAGYLFAHMTKSDYGRLYYSISQDGLRWRPLNGGRRILGGEYWGHPDICRGHDGQFYLVGNIGRNLDLSLWVSTNLVGWTKFKELRLDVSRVPGYRDNSGDHGAPKIFFDDATHQYLITWHSSRNRRHPLDTEAYWRGQRTLFITSPNLETFSAPARLFPWELATIDVIVRRESDRYLAFIKDEALPSFAWPTGKSIRLATAPTLTGPWSEPGPLISSNFREAPTVIPRPDGLGWYLYTEQYPGVQYTLATAPQLEGPWHEIYFGDYSLPPEARHGSMIPLQQPEYDALLATYGTP